MSETRKPFPLNAPGDFYVEDEMCLACIAPEHEAPDLMSNTGVDGAGYHCFFKRQPQTPEETTQAIRAVSVACCGAVRYGGRDPQILERLIALGSADHCDYAWPFFP